MTLLFAIALAAFTGCLLLLIRSVDKLERKVEDMLTRVDTTPPDVLKPTKGYPRNDPGSRSW